MSSRSELARNNIRTGIFVTAAFVLVVATIVAVSDLQGLLQQYGGYRVRYPIGTGIGALAEGSDVRVGGMKMGAVLEVIPISEGSKVQQLEVRFELREDVTLYDGAEVTVNSAMIGSESWLDIRNVGEGDPWPSAEPLVGYAAPAVLSGILGHQGAKDAGDFVAFLGDIRGEYEQRVVPTLESVDGAAASIRDVVTDLQQNHWEDWATRIDRVTAWAEGFTADVDAAMTEGRRLVGTVQETVDDNREDVRATVENVRDVTGHVKDQTLAKVDELLDHGRVALAETGEIVRSVGNDYDQWAVELGHTMANATLAAQQLKLATIEVRRNPWKILYRPQETELEHELLYESARSFALAAADLRATADAVRRVVDRHGPTLEQNEPSFRRLRENLDASLDRYTEAQQQLLDVLKTEVGGGG